jgi:UDP-GlcNAc:undecaprenyl-phosphate GlcNAc-1-phosphate transferase
MTLGAFSQHLLFATGLALLSAAVVRAMLRWPILDVPNARSAYAVATPRSGGLGVVAAFMVGMLVLYLVADFARLESLLRRPAPRADQAEDGWLVLLQRAAA